MGGLRLAAHACHTVSVIGTRSGTLVLLGVMFVGCASVRIPPPELGRVPTRDERTLLKRFAPPVIAAAQQEGLSCSEVSWAMIDMQNHDVRTAGRANGWTCDFFVQVSPHYLQTESSEELAGVLAHELSHVIDKDWTDQRARVPQIQKEREADARSIRILKRISPEACLVMVEYYQRILAEIIAAWGVEQWDTIDTHPSFTERIATFSAGCQERPR
ncbi:MAG TPA: hypothetical protein VL086_10765 [Candidatus Nitrosotalea sp.]|jgi:hypothetical protein|nr:hypothetical protein [Candidatus Nitrosotalea sp.]